MKDLLKPGRKINEYVNKDGSPKICCISCAHRPSIKDIKWGGYICGDEKRHDKCNPRFNKGFEFDHLLWKPRVKYDTFITDKDFE